MKPKERERRTRDANALFLRYELIKDKNSQQAKNIARRLNDEHKALNAPEGKGYEWLPIK